MGSKMGPKMAKNGQNPGFYGPGPAWPLAGQTPSHFSYTPGALGQAGPLWIPGAPGLPGVLLLPYGFGPGRGPVRTRPDHHFHGPGLQNRSLGSKSALGLQMGHLTPVKVGGYGPILATGTQKCLWEPI